MVTLTSPGVSGALVSISTSLSVVLVSSKSRATGGVPSTWSWIRTLRPSNPGALSLARTLRSALMATGDGSGLMDTKPMSFWSVDVGPPTAKV